VAATGSCAPTTASRPLSSRTSSAGRSLFRRSRSRLRVGIFAGDLSVEDFGVNTVTGATLAYHLTEKFFLQLDAGRTTAGLTSFERLSGAAQLLTDAQREYSYYNVQVGYDVLRAKASSVRSVR